MKDGSILKTTAMPSRAQRKEGLARWLHQLCVDWAPVLEDFEGKGCAERRKQMRRFATEAMKIAEGVKHDPA